VSREKTVWIGDMLEGWEAGRLESWEAGRIKN
jgi:hypothetical protein